VLVVDANRRVVWANFAAARILAVPTSGLLGRALPEFGLGLSADGLVTMAFGGHPRSTVPVQVQDAEGTLRWLVVSTRPLLEPGKTVPTEVLVSFADYTERRRTESHYQALAASLPDVAVVVVGDDLRVTVATGAGLAAAGWRAEDLLGRTPAEVLGADRARKITEAFRAALAGEHRVLQRVAGRERLWHTDYAPVRDQAGTVVAAMAVSRDVTDQVQAARRVQLLFDEAPIGIALTGPDGRWLQVNPALCALLGYTAEDLLARDFQSITHPDDLAASVEQMRRLLAGEISSFEMDKRYLHRDGHSVWTHLTVSITRHSDGSDRSFIAQIQDITDRRRVEQALQASEARYRRIVELADEGIWVIDAESRTTFVNARMAELLGYSAEEMLGRHLSEFMNENWWRFTDAAIGRRVQGTSERLNFKRLDVKFRRQDGSKLWAHLSARAIVGADGSYQGALALLTDITVRKAAEAELARLAWHDALTGLPNRARLLERVGEALTRQARTAGTVGLLFVDLDRFKAVNDSLGHAAGDRVLAQVADRLRRAVRDGDTVARLGGDEFVIVAEYLSGEGAAVDVAERIRSALADPITACSDIVVTASIGIALAYPPTIRGDRGRSVCDRARAPETLVHDADMAMYQAKARGRDCWHVCDRTATRDTVDRFRLLGELRHALPHDELRLRYQPRVDLRTGTVMGYEALVRWQHPRLGLLGPATFIDLAEDSGLIRELGGWVLREACRQAAEWHAGDPDRRPLEIAVNLSARQLADPKLTALLVDVLTHTGLDPTTLTLEVTETALMSDADAALGVLHALKDLGVRLAIDDFGTGYSSLIYLKRFPVDELKIDRSFVHGLGRETEDTAIVTSIVQLASAVGVQVVAEGVETDEQRDVLLAQGCQLGQGYLFAPPLPASACPTTPRHRVSEARSSA
jgi:diguanylate cyclase (GGDEF)-like protein/PAS domain S-box-containing protein